MALEHVLSELPVIIVAQGTFSPGDARNFAHDVARAFVFALS